MIQAVALLITAALVVGGLVGGDVIGGASPQEETASIEEVAIGYGESEGAAACDFLSASALDQLGGESGCTRSFESVPAAEFNILDVTVEGETGTASVENVDSGMKIELEFVKEGEEWKISTFPGLDQIAPPTGEAPTDELLQPPGGGELLPPGGGLAPPGPPPTGGNQPTP